MSSRALLIGATDRGSTVSIFLMINNCITLRLSEYLDLNFIKMKESSLSEKNYHLDIRVYYYSFFSVAFLSDDWSFAEILCFLSLFFPV